MNGKENIINKILADAEAKCTEILNVAKSQAEQVADSARQLSEREKQAVETRLEKLATERKGNYLATAQLEARKYRLGKKARTHLPLLRNGKTASCRHVCKPKGRVYRKTH